MKTGWKLVTKQINDRSRIPDFHSYNMATGAFLTLQDQKACAYDSSCFNDTKVSLGLDLYRG